MIIYADTRQKEGKHKNKDFKLKNIDVINYPLKVGDYMLSLDGKISVDTKQNIYELASCFFIKKEKARFQRECKRAKELGIKLYILIEQDFDRGELLRWKSLKKRNGELITKATGKQLYDRMLIYSIAFGVSWRFCSNKNTVDTMLKLLGVKNDCR